MLRWTLIAAAGLAMTGCQYLPFTGEKTGPEYKDAKVLPPLDLPPDLVSEATQPGLTLPPPAPGAGTSSVAPPSITAEPAPQAGAALVAPPQSALPTAPATATPGAQLQDQGDDAVLRVRMAPEQLWPVVSKTLQQAGYRIARQDAATGQLQTDWKPEREGLSALLGSAVSANVRTRYTVSMKAGENGVQLLTARQERQENDSGETGDVWTETSPDKKAGVSLLKAIQESLQQPAGTQQTTSQPTVERLEDAKGPYLVLSLPPEQARARVVDVLKTMGYDPQPGSQPGTFLLARNDATDQQGFFQSMFAQLKDGILGAFTSEDARAQTSLQLRLSPDAKSPGTVLEVLPVDDGSAGDESKAVRQVVDQLAERLRGSTG